MKILLLGLLVPSVICPTTVRAYSPSAQNAGTSHQHTSSDTDNEHGYRISDNGDFQIIEHGHWMPPDSPLKTQFSASGGVSAVQRSGTHKKSLKFRLHFQRTSYLSDVHAAEARFGIPHGLLDALIWTESRYNPRAISRAGAAGLGQLMPATAKDLGVVNRFDPYTNINGAARYLRQMFDRFGQIHLALAAYNAGPGTVSRVNGIPRNGETPSYVRSVLSFWQSKR